MAEHGGFQPIDFVRLAAELLQRADTLVPDWLRGGVRRGSEWVCGDLSGGEGGSVSVNLSTGRWADFANDDKGGDLVSLYAAIRNLGQREAALELMEDLGWERQRQAAPARAPRPAPQPGPAPEPARLGVDAPAARPRSLWRAIVPVPGNAPPCRFRWGYKDKRSGEWVELEAVDFWEYCFEQVRYGYVARFHRTNSRGGVDKETVPFTWCVDTSDDRGTMKWRPKQWDAPRPLYVPATLLGDPAQTPVVVVEGEKCAMAGHRLLGHEFDFVSWPGGGKAWPQASWGWLMGRTVFLWPDSDAKRERLTAAEREAGADPDAKPLLPAARQPGLVTMRGIGQLLQTEHGCTVHMVHLKPPGERADGWDIADAIAEGWGADQVRDFIRGASPFVAPEDAARAKQGAAISTPSMAAAREGEDGEDPARAWLKYLLSSTNGAVRPVRENVVLALDGRPERSVGGVPECAGLIAFNEFTNNIEKTRATPWGSPAGEWLEADELQMGDWLVREHWLPSISREQLAEAVLIVAKRHAFHPLRARIEALRGAWDGGPRLDEWLRRCCLEEDEWDLEDPLQRYLTLAGRYFVMGMCARVMKEKRHGADVLVGPGCKFDFMLILEGPQGWGKSTLAKTLGGDYFADTGLTIGEKDSLMNIQGIWVYEWGELDNMSKQEVSKVKLFISSPVDRFRATFDRRPAKYPRQVVFVGTTNESHYLTDTTGNRRFWPVLVTRRPDIAWLRENLEQMLAEAVHRVDAGERFWPTPEEQRQLFDPQQRERTVESSLESAIRTYLYDEGQKVPLGQPNGALISEVTMQDLLTRIGYTIDKQTDAVVKKAGAVMHMLGWTKRRLAADGEGKRPRAYVRPNDRSSSGTPHAAVARASHGTQRPTQGNTQGADSDCPF
jgi:predicted P-loop ATPase